MVARDNPKGQDAYYLKNFDTYVDLLKISNEAINVNNRILIIVFGLKNVMISRKTNRNIPKKHRGNQKEDAIG
ncbi:hypothetical protein J4727_17725 [Providencia rettgeri]|uniref:Uncharacterized protein n=1 Tax=Providencia rettgeri TaxID=587 RepID=A0A939NH08_PRORE|nr:hypothetical protein [Providencia rettgeri]